MEQPQFPVVFVPPPYPHLYRQPQEQQAVEIPPRVKVAMALLNELTSKSADKPLPTKLAHDSEVSFEAMPGQKLTATEIGAQNAALELLQSYFRGDLRACQWDRPRKQPKQLQEFNLRIPCPNCNGKRNSPLGGPCMVCNGSGVVRMARESDDEA